MKTFPILYWPRKSKSDTDTDYQTARRVISTATGIMPEVISADLDVVELLSQNPNAVLYFPVFCESTGWWGELLGSDAKITDKLIVSAECQLMVISRGDSKKSGTNQLLAAEIYPTSGFFKKMDSEIGVVSDMLATSEGTILALFSGKNQTKFVNVLDATGNSFLGCIGRY